MKETYSNFIHGSSYPPGGSDPSGGGYNPGGYQPGGYQQGGYPQASYPAPQYGQPGGWQGGELAGLGPRILAYLIDGVIVGIIELIGYIALFVFAAAGSASQTDAGASAGVAVGFLALAVMIGVAIVVMFLNAIYFAGKNNGQTIGKKMMKIRIVKEDGTPFGYMDGFLRNIIGYWISGLICGLGFFWGLFDSRNQTWHDKIFHTYVVRA